MGIEFSHCEARWGYGAFNNFRTKLAKEIGIDLDRMEGFVSDGCGLSWDKIMDPIKDLLDHSDCDGDLTPKQCRTIAPRLKELVVDWSDEDPDKRKALLLAEGMAWAAEQNEKFLFC